MLTRNKDFVVHGCEVSDSIEETLTGLDANEEYFVIGGEVIYQAFLPYAGKLYITTIEHEFLGDTYFPQIDFSQWQEVSVTKGITDEKNPYVYYFREYVRREESI